MTIWQQLPKPFFLLAPMEAVTDSVFRRVVTAAAPPDVFFSEFTNATGWVHAGEKAAAGRITLDSTETVPVIAQIWGVVPADIAKLAKECNRRGFAGIDINMGCPEKSAVKSGGGAAMCLHPALAAEIIAAAKTSKLPVSVKCRLGYSKLEEYKEWIPFLLRQDIAALTVHLRTQKEMSKVPAHWELMSTIKVLRDKIAPQTLVIGNGDVNDRTHGERLLNETGIDGIMIGRGIFTNVFGFELSQQHHTQTELLNLLKLHLDLFEQTHSAYRPGLASKSHSASEEIFKQVQDKKKGKPYETLKRFYKIYVRDFPGSSELRNELMQTNTIAEARAKLSMLD